MRNRDLIKHRWHSTLLEAYHEAKPIDSLTSNIGKLSTKEAYDVQAMLLENKIQNREGIIGWKVGATSQAVMTQLKIDEPILGHITSSSYYSSLREIKASNFCKLAVEGEIAFIMGKSLRGPGITNSDVIISTAGIMGAVELVDCRLKHWNVDASEAIADNSLHAGVILGPFIKPIAGFDLRYEGVIMSKDGRLLASACGVEALGDPVNVVTWLGNKLPELGREIQAGQIILTGSLTRFFFVGPGDVINVSFSNLGNIHFNIGK